MTKAEAVQHFGGVAPLADVLGIRYQAVQQWDEIPMRRQYEIERLTGGKLIADSSVVYRDQAA